MPDKNPSYQKLIQEIKQCQKCPLKKTCHLIVPGEGNIDTQIMFIGEAPGAKEDKTGHPFVGAAGKFLEEMLETIQLKRKDVYIANIVKCRPPHNRDPFPEEIQACWPWLEKQIKIIQPLLIVTLGRHAMEKFLPGQKISQVHGKALRRTIPELGEQVFYTLYHPAAALYNGSLRQVLIKDFQRIPQVLKIIKKEIQKQKLQSSFSSQPPEQESLF